MYTILWLENMKRRDQLEDIDIDARIILEIILGKYCGNV
jgi:hypothetical protein